MSSDLSPGFGYALYQAITQWHNILSTRIGFNIVTGSSPLKIVIYESDGGMLNSQYIKASWPENGEPGPVIQIDSYECSSLSHNQKVTLLMHALGHCIGIAHTNNFSYYGDLISGEKPVNDIYGTPTNDINPDPNSVFNSFSDK